MRLARRQGFVLCCVLSMCVCPLAQARESVTAVIPSDALAFVVLHDLADVSQTVDGLAGLVTAPPPGLLTQAKMMSGLEKGLDEQGDLALVVTQILPMPKTVLLVPVANFADFCAALNVAEPTGGVVTVQIVGQPRLMGRIGNFALLAKESDRDALEHLLATGARVSADESLKMFVDSNKVSAVLTSLGLKQVMPQAISGLLALEAAISAQGGEQAPAAIEAVHLYAKLFTAIMAEVNQVAVGLRVDPGQNVDIVKQVDFNPQGTWIKWVADIQPSSGDLLAGLPDVPFVVAGGGVVSPAILDHLMKFSVQMMQNMPGQKLTPEQAAKYVDLSKGAMQGVKSMGMVLGIAEPGTGIYGNTTAVMTVEDSKSYMQEYEGSLTKLSEFAKEAKNPMIPVTTCQRMTVGETEALEISMDMKNMPQFAGAGGPDPKKVLEMMFGSSEALKIYVAPADEHTIVMSYFSSERLNQVLNFVKSKYPGLSDSAPVAQVASLLPPDGQVVGYVSLNGVSNAIRQFAAIVAGGRAPKIPDLPECPPLGVAAKATPQGVESHLVIAVETLRAIGKTAAQARGPAEAPK